MEALAILRENPTIPGAPEYERRHAELAEPRLGSIGHGTPAAQPRRLAVALAQQEVFIEVHRGIGHPRRLRVDVENAPPDEEPRRHPARDTPEHRVREDAHREDGRLVTRQPRGVDEHQALDVFGMREGVVPGHVAAHRVADEREASEAQGSGDVVDEARHLRGVVAPEGIGAGEPVSGKVERHDAMVARERSGPPFPSEERGVRAVEQDHGGTVAAIADMHPEAGGVDEPRRCERAPPFDGGGRTVGAEPEPEEHRRDRYQHAQSARETPHGRRVYGRAHPKGNDGPAAGGPRSAAVARATGRGNDDRAAPMSHPSVPRVPSFAVWAVAATLTACSSPDVTSLGTPDAAVSDDRPADAPLVDAGVDAMADGAVDAARDAARDVVGDARDAAVDVHDASLDVPAVDVVALDVPVVDVPALLDVVDAGTDRGPLDVVPSDTGIVDAGAPDVRPVDVALADVGADVPGDASVVAAPRPAQLAAGYLGGCAVRAGGVYCWGPNPHGELGDGTTATRLAPVAVAGITDAVEVASKLMHTCARRASGVVSCWGTNSSGELGDGTMVDRATPVAVSGLRDATQVALGTSFACAVRAGGTVVCWGYNTSGQLGDGTYTTRLVPVAVSSLSGAVQVALGGSHGCALRSDGTVYCWGSNFNGVLGNGSTSSSQTPVAVTGLTDATQIAAGGTTTCALRRTGAVVCWGDGSRGQIGDGSASSRNVPTAAGITGATRVAVGETHVCATLGTGALRCWGGDDRGQFVDVDATNKLVPTAIAGLADDVTDVAAGSFHTCVTRLDGSLACWGETWHQGVAAPLPGLTATGVTLGLRHGCAVGADRHARCWGANIYGELGDGTLVGHTAPALVSGGASLAAVDAGNNHTCARDDAGGVLCWGNNTYGQLGDGTLTSRTAPVAVAGLHDATVLSDGYHHACALRAGGTVVCWGNNTYGQLGDGTLTTATSPVAVVGITDAVDVYAGAGSYTCVRHRDAGVSCWGRVPGATSSTNMTPTRVAGLANVAELAGGSFYLCARRTDGAVLCWGSNFSGALGDGTMLSHTAPAPVTGLVDAASLAGGPDFACAARRDGTVVCWGYNQSGQLGDGTFVLRPSPVAVPGLGNVTAVVAARAIGISSNGFACAVRGDASVWCWGENWFTQLGRTFARFTIP